MASALLHDLIALTLDAGRVVMEVRDAGCEAMDKYDGSPVTVADQRAEALIEEGLARIAPGVPMLGEEASASGRIPDLGSRFFCVDPIDGTRDFIAASGEFTVNIALIENGAPILGVVFAPATGEMFAADADGACKGKYDGRTGAEIEPLRRIHAAPAPVHGAWRIIASRRSGANDRTAQFLLALGAHERATASSSIKFCRLAEGGGDLYPRFGDVSEWDAAAGHAVLAAAGGGVVRHDGGALTYGHADNKFLIHGFIAYANPEAAAAARAAVDKL